jgi:AcrR family transcriptional regulator
MAGGLREQKKARARAAMAAVASQLFGEYGYDAVSMAQIARAAAVSEQTLYNYFPTKESLVFDRADEFETTLVTAVADRTPGTDPVEAFRRWLETFLLRSGAAGAAGAPGGMVRQAAASQAVHRALLASADRAAFRLASNLTDRSPAEATVLAHALLGVYVRTVERLGRQPEASGAAVAATARDELEALRPLTRSRPT